MTSVEIIRLDREEMTRHLGDLAALRMSVFAEYPYLYDGDIAYERYYLSEFASEPGSVLIAARDGENIVGAATCSPMAGQKQEFQAPFLTRDYDIDRIYYFGESVLLPAFRGKGIGKAFFVEREKAARDAKAEFAAFCAVIRAEDHPLRPADYRPLDPFWRSRGFRKIDGLTTRFDWAEHGYNGDIAHEMQFWIAAL